MNNKTRFTLGRLFDNNKFVLLVSLLMAFIIWLSFSMYGGEQQEKTVDVPIKMDSMTVPNQFNLQQFGEYSNSSVTVTVVGKKAVIGTVTADDIRVTASTLDVNTAGKHTLPLSVSVDSTKDFQIISTNTLSVEVYFDVYKEVKLAVKTDLSQTPSAPDGYEIGTLILSSDKLLAYGPSTEVSKIEKIYAKADIDELLTSTTTYNAVIVATDKYGNEIQNISIKDSDDFKITIPVFKLATLPVSVELANIPDGLDENDIDITYSVTKLRIAGEEETIDGMSTLVIGTIDFSELKNEQNTFELSVSGIAGIKVKSGVSTVRVTVDLSDFKSKEVALNTSAIELLNTGAKKVNIYSDILTITVAGAQSNLDKLTSSDLAAVLRVTDSTEAGESQQLAISVNVANVPGVWVVGTYEVTADVE